MLNNSTVACFGDNRRGHVWLVNLDVLMSDEREV